jgi:hypothetical protein
MINLDDDIEQFLDKEIFITIPSSIGCSKRNLFGIITYYNRFR